jgi:DNA-binding SARP family transcriptional activator
MATAGETMEDGHGTIRGAPRGNAWQADKMSRPALELRVLGPVALRRNGETVPFPRSRKVRALLAYLVLGQGPVSRSRLCDLLWDVPNDPRGELRWCLSKLRNLLDDDEHRRVVSSGDLIELDLSDCVVDALEVDRATKADWSRATNEHLVELCELFGGELLESLQIDGNPEFSGWLTAQRHRYRTMHVAALRELVTRSLGPEETFRRLEAWLQVAPHDQRAHEVLLASLVRSGRVRDAEAHVATTIRSFEAEGLDWAPLRVAWQTLRNTASETPRVESPQVHSVALDAQDAGHTRQRASVAVMPFVEIAGSPNNKRSVADGLTEDIITRLAKLRVVFVIARGTVFALGERGVGVQEAGHLLNVQYVVSGSVRRHGSRHSVFVELAETRDARIVWTDEFDGAADDTFAVLDSIVNRIVSAVTKQIETAECNRAIIKAPNSLDAWEAYHRGLWHMYKFNGPNNQDAHRFFSKAVQMDPTFARAYAGLSFTHFQNVFLELTPDRERQIDLAFEAAGQSLSADDQDPAAHWAMGRALWLRGSESLDELERSVELSPNFALGHYTLGFVHAQTGDPRSAIHATNHSRELSPFDPLQFAMLASRAMAHVRLGEFEEAAQWAVRATGRPNAHAHILAIAAECLALAEKRDDARAFVARVRERIPTYGVEEFLRAMRFGRDTADLFRKAARQIGFDDPAGRDRR